MYSRMAVAFPVPVRPVTKMLYPGFSSPSPNWRARKPRSCPMNSASGVSSSVHSNSKVAGSCASLRSSGGMRSFSTSIIGCLASHFLGALEPPAVDVPPVAVDLPFAKEEGYLPLGRLRGVGAVDKVTACLQGQIATNGAGL